MNAGGLMRKLFLVLILLSTLGLAQETRKEIVNRAPTPEGDTKPNSDSVPGVYSVAGKFDRVEVWRFKFNADLLAGIEQMVKQEKIKNAVILAGAGSVRNYQVHQVSNRDFPSKNVFVKDPSAPADIISMNGYVINGSVHAHMTMANPEHAFGGHIEPGTTVFTFAIVTVGILNDAADLSRMDDKTYR
jgi:predicted DNA-binding protein with PD1-like motif